MGDDKVAKGFNFLAPFYDFALKISIGHWIKKTQLAHFDNLNSAESILIFGGGTGWILPFLNQFPELTKIVFIDISAMMLRQAQKHKLSDNIEVIFIEGSCEEIPNMKFDAIITPFVLDCIPEDKLTFVVGKLKSRLKSNGVWLFSDFNSSSNKIKNNFITLLYSLFNVICKLGIYSLPNFDSTFKSEGLKIVDEKLFFNQLMVSKLIVDMSSDRNY